MIQDSLILSRSSGIQDLVSDEIQGLSGWKSFLGHIFGLVFVHKEDRVIEDLYIASHE